jgi:hypothetical protein
VMFPFPGPEGRPSARSLRWKLPLGRKIATLINKAPPGLFAFVIAVFPVAATLAGPKEDAEAA